MQPRSTGPKAKSKAYPRPERRAAQVENELNDKKPESTSVWRALAPFAEVSWLADISIVIIPYACEGAHASFEGTKRARIWRALACKSMYICLEAFVCLSRLA